MAYPSIPARPEPLANWTALGDAWHAALTQVTGWSYTDLGSTAAAWTPGTAYRVRVSLQGGTVRVRQWAATATEPSTWGVTATTTQTATGSWGFFCGPGGTAAAYTAAFDDIVIG